MPFHGQPAALFVDGDPLQVAVGDPATDGKRGVFDCEPYMQYEFMEDVREPSKFAAVMADHGTASWPGGEDLCPDDLYMNMR